MADALKKVKPGDPLAISAGTFNSFIDAAKAHRERQHQQAQTGTPAARHDGLVLIKNASGADVDRFGVLGIDSALITPTDNADEFKSRPAIKGVTPTISHDGKFVILLEPVANGEMGTACVSGLCPVQVSMRNPQHRYAQAEAATTGYLVSSTFGPARCPAFFSGALDRAHASPAPPRPRPHGRGYIRFTP